MSQTGPQWKMLKDELRDVIEAQQGFRVTHALFTTYAFEPAFFESLILPLLLPEGERNLSLHSAVRRLQVEAMLRASPISVDVYFDARVAMPGCALLPYRMHPMHIAPAEFHGKVVLLRMEDERGSVRFVLGAGSANLTKAGWWENIEAWYFASAFDPRRTPAGIRPALNSLFRFLRANSQADQPTAAATMRSELEQSSNVRMKSGEPVFGVFLPAELRNENTKSFPGWLERLVPAAPNKAPIEVISPYFCDAPPAALIKTLYAATHGTAAHVWLPEDPWHAGGTAALIEAARYNALAEVDTLRWCRMAEANLAAQRNREKPPRFLHAKVIRQPGNFCFMGSVNFSYKAFHHNFEAGFLFPDNGQPWLTPQPGRPARFLKPAEPDRLEGSDAGIPNIVATFDWQLERLHLSLMHGSRDKNVLEDADFQIVDAKGKASGKWLALPVDIKADSSLCSDLKTNPWIRLRFRDGRKALVWVQQTALEYRPPPENLNPNVWRILEMWRGLAEGRMGSQPGDFEPLEIVLRARDPDDEALPAAAPVEDVFQAMSAVHGSFHLLRQRLKQDAGRREYYFSAPRPDTLITLIDRFEQPAPEDTPVEPVAKWVILQWVGQICRDHLGAVPAANALLKRAVTQLETLLASKPMCDLDQRFLDWSARMFLCNPGSERYVARSITRTERQS